MHPTSSRRHRSSSSVSRSGMPPGAYPHRYSISSQPATGDIAHRDHRSSSVVSTPRYEELAQQRAELEEVKKENETLKQRIRDLERMIRGGMRMRRGGGEGHHSGSRAMGRMVLPSLKESPSEGVRMREKERRRRSDEDDSSIGICSVYVRYGIMRRSFHSSVFRKCLSAIDRREK